VTGNNNINNCISELLKQVGLLALRGSFASRHLLRVIWRSRHSVVICFASFSSCHSACGCHLASPSFSSCHLPEFTPQGGGVIHCQLALCAVISGHLLCVIWLRRHLLRVICRSLPRKAGASFAARHLVVICFASLIV
jgi:hypothetical protein